MKNHKNNATVSHAHSILTVLKSDWIVLFCQVSFGQELPDENRQPYKSVRSIVRKWKLKQITRNGSLWYNQLYVLAACLSKPEC